MLTREQTILGELFSMRTSARFFRLEVGGPVIERVGDVSPSAWSLDGILYRIAGGSALLPEELARTLARREGPV